MTFEMVALVLSFILFLTPKPDAEQLKTMSELAEAISRVSQEKPLFEGKRGQENTAALLVSIAYFESSFHGMHRGDHGNSVGFFQIWPRKGDPSKDELEQNIPLQANLARERIAESFHSCSYGDPGDRLALYASGSCSRGIRESRRRMNQAIVLMREVFPRVQQAL